MPDDHQRYMNAFYSRFEGWLDDTDGLDNAVDAVAEAAIADGRQQAEPDLHDARRVIAALCYQSGGAVNLSTRALAAVSDSSALITSTDPASGEVVIRLAESRQVGPETGRGCTHDAHAEQLRRLQHTMNRRRE